MSATPLTRQIRSTVLERSGVGSLDCSRLRRLRKQLRLSQDDVADWVGVNRSSVSHWERGRRRLSADHTRLVAQVITELERLAREST